MILCDIICVKQPLLYMFSCSNLLSISSLYFIPVYIMVFILHTNTDNNGFFLMTFRVNSESTFFLNCDTPQWIYDIFRVKELLLYMFNWGTRLIVQIYCDFKSVYIKVLILHTNTDNNVFFIMASCWLLWQPQIREYYNWSLKCNYAGRGTELYNIAIHPNDYVTLFVLKSPCYICFLVQIYFDFKSVFHSCVYYGIYITY